MLDSNKIPTRFQQDSNIPTRFQQDSNKKKQKKPSAAKWLVFNIGTDLEFAECSNCGAELGKDKYDEYDMPQRCYKCGAQIRDIEFPD